MSTQFKLGFDGKRAFHNFRGLGNYSRTLIEGLVRYAPEMELTLFTPPYDANKLAFFQSSLNQVEVRTPEGLLGKAFPSMWRTLGIADDLKGSGLDLYHGLSHELPRGIEGLPLKKVVTIHDLIYRRYPEFFPWIDRKVYHKKFSHSVQVADRVLAICEQTKSDLIHYLNVPAEKISVVYQACHPRFYESWSEVAIKELRARHQLERPYVLSVGAFEKRKNLLHLIHAYARLAHEVEHDLVLVGNGRSYLQRMQELIAHYKLEKRIHLLTQLENENLPGIYQGASLFVFPSFYEGFGLPIVEALFSEVPVITSEGSCFPESGGPSSVYIDPNNVDQMHEEMLNLLTNEERAHWMKTQGREFVEKFHLRETTRALVDFYGSVISERLVSS